MSIAERIHVACVAAGISQAELARRVPCKPQQITDLIKNKRGFSKHFPRIAEVLGINVAWLTTGEGPWRRDATEHNPPQNPIPVDIGMAILRELREIREFIGMQHTAPDRGPPADALEQYDRDFADAATKPRVRRTALRSPKDGRTEDSTDEPSHSQPVPVRV